MLWVTKNNNVNNKKMDQKDKEIIQQILSKPEVQGEWWNIIMPIIAS